MVALVAAIAPMLVAALPERWRVPQVVVLIFSGILIGPHVLGLSETSSVKLLANIGLGFLFLLAGYELDLRLLRAHEGRLAMIGWVVSAVISLVAVAGLTKAGFVRDFIPIALALTTTALGTLLPILSDNEMLGGPFGRYVLAAGAVGEPALPEHQRTQRVGWRAHRRALRPGSDGHAAGARGALATLRAPPRVARPRRHDERTAGPTRLALQATSGSDRNGEWRRARRPARGARRMSR